MPLASVCAPMVCEWIEAAESDHPENTAAHYIFRAIRLKKVFFRDRCIDNQPNHRMITFEAKILTLEADVLTKRCNGAVAWQRHG